MKYLFVGKTGVFDTLAIAMGYMGTPDLEKSLVFANLEIEQSAHFARVYDDKKDPEVYVVGDMHPGIIATIDQELKTLSNTSENPQLQVIPITVPGDKTNWVLVYLAQTPLIGTWFLNWARARTLKRKDMLYEIGEDLRRKHKAMARQGKSEQVLAAKPLQTVQHTKNQKTS